jgi:adenylate kinase
MLAIVFGIQGVGKSSVVSKVVESFPQGQWTSWVFGDDIFRVAQEQGVIKVGDYQAIKSGQVIVEDPEKGIAVVRDQGLETIYVKDASQITEARDYMRVLNIATQKVLQSATLAYYAGIYAKDPEGCYLINTHAALKTKQGYMPGMTRAFLEQAKPDLFIVIEADAQEIFDRRVSDPTRKRDHDKTVKDVQINLDTTRYFAADFASTCDGELLIVQNEQGKLDEAAAAIADVLKRFI